MQPRYAIPVDEFSWVSDWEGRGLQRDIPELITKARSIAEHIPSLNEGGNFPLFGAVVGSVQSGKTASMVGLISHLYDMGYDMVTVLTGTTNDLYSQTALRMKNDLFEHGDAIVNPRTNQVIGYTSPLGEGPHKASRPIENYRDFYSPEYYPQGNGEWNGWQNFSRTIVGETPILFVSKKRVISILPKMRGVVETLNRRCLATLSRPLRWAIIDDECDSVTSGAQGASTPPVIREICEVGECVYVGYTATAQANLFNPDIHSNPCFPSAFCSLLRYPHHRAEDDFSAPSPDVSYQTGSINEMYCGGWTFHNWCEARGADNFFHIPSSAYQGGPLDQGDLVSALSHYLVSGASRWILDGRAAFPTSDSGVIGDLPKAHTMLINPSRLVDTHWSSSSSLINSFFRSAGMESVTPEEVRDEGTRARMWERAKAEIDNWLESNTDAIYEAYQGQSRSFSIVDRPSWDDDYSGVEFPEFEEVRSAILEIVPHIKLKILNGDSEDVLNYERRSSPDVEGFLPPDDIFTIAIGGIKMGRGLTIEGLCTTLFLTGNSADDTTIQRQRWFGYRGSHLEYCRVFMPDPVWSTQDTGGEDGLAEINSRDESLKQLIASNDNAGIPPDPESPHWAFLVNDQANISTKVDAPRTLAFVGRGITKHVTLRRLNRDFASSNISQIDNLFGQMLEKGMPDRLWTHPTWENEIGFFCGTPFDGSSTAVVLHESHGSPFTSSEIAEFLDSLSFCGHNPDPERDPLRIYNNVRPGGARTIEDIHRSIDAGYPEEQLMDATSDPYALAAYLRMWEIGHEDEGASQLSARTASPPPMFNVLIRHPNIDHAPIHRFSPGSISTDSEINLSRTRAVNPSGYIGNLQFGSVICNSNWGSDMRPDDIRDNWDTSADWVAQRTMARSTGQPALLLIYLMEDDQGGPPAPLLLYSIPEGGPILSYQ